MKIAYLGPEKTFTGAAARHLFPDAEFIPLYPIRRVVRAVENGEVDQGVVPIENFYNGEIIETLDALMEVSKTKILRDKGFKIVHCLGVLPECGDVKQILSKDQALAQCDRYLSENHSNAATIAVKSTAEAVERIVSERLLDSAAIASEQALVKNGLKILDKDLCPNNKTRFVVLGRNLSKPTGKDKTFLAIHPTNDEPGILYKGLAFFANLGVNLDYIQSRPDGKGGYYFYIELEGHEEDKNVELCLQALKHTLDPNNEYSSAVKILGCYPNTDWKNGD